VSYLSYPEHFPDLTPCQAVALTGESPHVWRGSRIRRIVRTTVELWPETVGFCREGFWLMPTKEVVDAGSSEMGRTESLL
jgi:hypothetical protein